MQANHGTELGFCSQILILTDWFAGRHSRLDRAFDGRFWEAKNDVAMGTVRSGCGFIRCRMAGAQGGR